MTMADAPEAEPAKPIPKDQQHPRDPSRRKPPRRCAKCAAPARESEFKNDEGAFTPYCAGCRGRFPSLASPRLVIADARRARKR